MTVVPLQQRGRRGVKLAETLAQEIVSDITRSGMAPGDRFPSEVVMARERGVSRASLREALRVLEVHGLISIKSGPGGGPELAKTRRRRIGRDDWEVFIPDHHQGFLDWDVFLAKTLLFQRMQADVRD